MSSLVASVRLAEPSPSASATSDPLGDVTEAAAKSWDWLLGVPLRIFLIVVIGAISLAVLRRVIRKVTEHIADGSSLLDRGPLRPLGESEMASALLKAANPLANARRAQRARTIGSVLRSGATLLVGGTVAILVLDTLGVNVAPFLASAGVLGVAIGFGAQSLVKDFLSGLFMLLEDQYGVGDVIDVGPASGTVEAVALRVTKIRDGDGTLWYVPNGTMLRVGNKTQGWAKAVVEIDVDYFADLDEVRSLLTEAASKVADDPVVGTYLDGEPTITSIEKLTSEAVTLRLSVRTAPSMQWEVARALRVQARAALESADIPLAGQLDRLTALRAGRQASAPDDDAPVPGTQGAAPDDR
ncbi:mechanosensitive ion channel family protein [Cellulomonas soli]|uniref:Mechanosensitive ion channel protein MscS n=1 Tax=Cellulomonas soli TaxID=931535 RepID=A0A512PB14_9CELL|nr:mechanosensitive ion channel family protein [Cellulomonas soli]NYI57319.1 small conductance mechanosensitive channel [Cellulomonas soli]GEP68401.1 mechanosensitive ion channel protein MscS [Cellulomonas soli]